MSRICLVNGRHTPGSEWERECPLRNAAARSERSRKAAQTRRDATAQEAHHGDRNPAPCGGIAGPVDGPPPEPHKQRVSGGRFLSPGDLPKNSRRAGGRPRKHRTDAVAHAAAQRAYRARQVAQAVAANNALLS
jgi:hypothetical protein